MFRIVQLPDRVSGNLYLHSMPGRYETFSEAISSIVKLNIDTVVCLTPMNEILEKSPDYAEAIQTGNLRAITGCLRFQTTMSLKIGKDF